MTVMDLLRGVRPASDEAPDDGAPGDGPREVAPWLPGPLRDVLVGLLTGLLSLLVVVVVTMLGWMLDPRDGGSLAEPLGAASSLWLLVQGAHLGAGATTIAFVPLLLGAMTVLVAARGAARALEDADPDDELVADALPRSVVAVASRWWVGYAVAVALAAALTLAGSLPLRWVTLVLPAVVVPALGLVVALRRLSASGDVLGSRLDGSAIPESVRRAWSPALRGLLTLLGLGALLVLVAVVVRWESVAGLQAEVGGGFFGGLLLLAAQVGALPNLALWALSFLAGPGFSVVDGAHVSLNGSSTGLMPLIPVLGAVPEPGEYPWFAWLLTLVPVLVGGLIGRRSLKAVARLSSMRTKVSVAAVASLIVALAVGVLDAVAGGSLGAYRLADVGAPALWLTLALGAELLVGALLVVLWDAWRLRR